MLTRVTRDSSRWRPRQVQKCLATVQCSWADLDFHSGYSKTYWHEKDQKSCNWVRTLQCSLKSGESGRGGLIQSFRPSGSAWVEMGVAWWPWAAHCAAGATSHPGGATLASQTGGCQGPVESVSSLRSSHSSVLACSVASLTAGGGCEAAHVPLKLELS